MIRDSNPLKMEMIITKAIVPMAKLMPVMDEIIFMI
jgi:hypothetical protein